MKTHYKHIHFCIKENIWCCYNTRHDEFLGFVYEYPPWKQYIFEPHRDTIFSVSCMVDIQDFITNVTLEEAS